MTKEEFKLFLTQSINSKGKSLDKAKKFFKISDEKTLKRKLAKVLNEL